MKDAFNQLFEILLDYGLAENQITALLAQFLQEEAVKYIEAMEMCGVTADDLNDLYNDTLVS